MERRMTQSCGCEHCVKHMCIVHCVSQKDPGFDRGQFHKQVAVMRGQVRFLFSVKSKAVTVFR